MQPNNLHIIQESFTAQAKDFESPTMNFSKAEYLEYTLTHIEPGINDKVLEVAAGTCICGRKIAPRAQSVVCVDATPAMLNIGREEAAKCKLSNISFVEGLAEELPFPDETFDIVMTRLSFHHFTEMERPFSEMNRVLKKNGKLVIIDMEAASEKLREIEDRIEIMRDHSHVRNRSREEFVQLYDQFGYQIKTLESTHIPVELEAWMKLTGTSLETQTRIVEYMEDDIHSGRLTGFSPYIKDKKLYFDQRWLLMIGIK